MFFCNILWVAIPCIKMLIFVLVLFFLWDKFAKQGVGGRMFRFVEKKRPLDKFFMVVCIALVLAVFSSNIRIQAAEYSASLSTDRASGVCTYTVTGIPDNLYGDTYEQN